ncbi:MAG: sigma 54-dependent Fis family transcriptional regulator [Deltaproteobacteria bacterium]|nr:sigma 54-dependent Fis family transcriptional regulator [Deltaproteobacteria bacterium]
MADRGDRTRIMTSAEVGKQAGRLMRRKLRLEVEAGVDAGASVVGTQPVVHVGTQQGNVLQLNDEAVSRIHLEVASVGDRVRVRDLGSTNGTWLPGRVKVTDAVVPSGSRVILGRSRVRIDVLDEVVAESLSAGPGFGSMIGESEAMRAVFALLERVAPTDETVLITGETGVGKEVCAQSIVAQSRRRSGPLVVVDCGALPPSLLESELFGHMRGAFTGAVAEHRGAFERANNGTLFLDEVGELPLELQTRLLRAVEQRTVRRVGGTREIPLDIRILAATNRPLEEEVNRGTFRADLFYRLSVVQVRIPPLRERPEDIVPLARQILKECHVDPDATLSDLRVVEYLNRHAWPGNARELRNYLRRTSFGGNFDDPGTRPIDLPETNSEDVDLALAFKDAKEEAIRDFERRYLEQLLARADGNISHAARIAQTDRTYLTRLLIKHGLK